jgi:hypothetical protein
LFGALKKQPVRSTQTAADEHSNLARFIFQDAHCKRSIAKPKPNAFLPHPPNLKISALWRDQLPEAEIWTIGDLLGANRGKPPLARADFNLAAVREAKLSAEADPEPHPRHVNLSGWPIEKDEQKAVAILLCQRSTLIMR